MDHSTLANIFYFTTSLAAILIIATIGFLAYYAYKVVRRVEEAGTKLMSGISTFEESIKKLPFMRSASKTRRKRSTATVEEEER